MGIPIKALRESAFITKNRIGEGSHETYRVSWGDPVQQGFFKKLDQGYPELLAKISVATSSLKCSAQGNRSAQEMLVFDDADHIVGTVSLAVKEFKPLNFQSEPVPAAPEEREQVIPSTERLIETNVIENIFADWANGNNDAHPHNIGYVASNEGSKKSGYFFNIDFDMFFYWFTVYMKGGPRPTLSNPKIRINLTVPDYENFPCIEEPDYFHWYTLEHPGKKTWPAILPEILQNPILATAFAKTYAAPAQFAALAADPRAQEQKFVAALKTLLTFQPEVQRQRFVQLFGDLTLNYKSLSPAVRAQYEHIFPQFCNDKSNDQHFVDFMMKLYQEHYDSLYRVVVFYMGCEKNKYGVPLSSTNMTLYKKPSVYQHIKKWIIEQNKTTYTEPEIQFNLDELIKRYHQIWRDSFQPRLEKLRRDTFNLLSQVRLIATTPSKKNEISSKDITDISLTTSWQLFSDMPDFSIKEEEMGLDKHHHLRDAYELLNKFTQQLEKIKDMYYGKKIVDLEARDGHYFSKALYDLCNDESNFLISKHLGHGVYAPAFLEIKEGLRELARQANFMEHLSSTDEHMQKMPSYVEKAPLPYTDPTEINDFCTCLFGWAKNLSREKFNRYLIESIEKYAHTLTVPGSRKRAEPVKKYLKESDEPNDRRLAYILTSGSRSDGALNLTVVGDLLKWMLAQHYLPSISLALKDEAVKEIALTTLTQAAINFARVNIDCIHLFSLKGCELFYEALYEWVGDLPKQDLLQIIGGALREYEKTKWTWFGTPLRSDGIKGYFTQYEARKALALTFMGGNESTASACVLVAIINAIKKELKSTDLGYQLIQQFNETEHKTFYIEHMKNKVTERMSHLQEPQPAAAAAAVF